MGFGYTGRILRVDLTSGTTEIEEPGDAFYRRYLGGGMLASYYLLKELRPGTDPLGPDNLLVFAAPVLTGVPASGMVRFTVAARSPLTGGYGETEAGGFWGPELKFAGFDAVVVRGRAPELVYLWIKDGVVEIRSAAHLAGKLAGEVEDGIREELGDQRIRVAQAGPAGEKLVRFAAVANNLKHFNGRTGMGAVMGSKNLRAIAVRGTEKVPTANPEKVQELARWFARQGIHPLQELGTAGNVLALNAMGILPTRNFQDGSLEGAEGISGERMKDTLQEKHEACYACSVSCKRVVKSEGEFPAEARYGGPEYESLGSLGSNCGVTDLRAVVAANNLCNAHVADVISTGMVVAFAMECYERGILTNADTDGLELRFGNAGAMYRMVEKVLRREGLGDILAEGVVRAAKQIGRGAEQFAMHVKGQECPAHDPRGKTGVGLAYALSPTGADHLEAPHDPAFINPKGAALRRSAPLGITEPVDPFALDAGKVRWFNYAQDIWGVYNSLGVCVFVSFPSFNYWNAGELLELVSATTGWDYSLWELMKAGERANAMSRVFNCREGFGPADDTLPDRYFGPLQNGPLKGRSIDREAFRKAVDLYYGMAGWDATTGAPRPAKLKELDLGWLAGPS